MRILHDGTIGIASHARALIHARPAAKMRLPAGYLKPRPALFAGPTVALTDNA
jgi:hypothetical protein